MISRIPTVCPYCAVGCGFYLTRSGMEYMQDHPVNEGSLCPKGNAALDVLNHVERLRYPMMRVGGDWIRVSWGEALDRIAEEMDRALRERGPKSIAFLGSAKCTNEENYLFQKLARLMGTNSIDNSARRCHSPTIIALRRILGTPAMTNPITDLALSDCILVFGSNLAENHPVVARWILRAKDRGAAVIVADPRVTPTAWLADLHLQLNPGTDIALINGMINVILREGLESRSFIKDRTKGFEELDVSDYTPERVSSITGLSAGDIVRAARLYARARASAIVYCMGITQHSCGTDNVTACANLALVCGQIGRPGSGILPLRGQNNVQGACDMGALADFYPGWRSVDDPMAIDELRRLWNAGTLPLGRGLTADMMPDADLRFLHVMGEDIVNSDPTVSRRREKLRRGFMVVQDIFMTDTAKLADLVLPAAAWAEKEGTFTSTERRVQWISRAREPPGEARPDLWILAEVAARLGFELPSDPEEALAEINQAVPAYRGISRSNAGARGGIIWPCPHPDHPGTPVLHTERFSTPEGRARITPVHHTPLERGSPEHPMILLTGRVVLHYNSGSMTMRSEGLVKRDPESHVDVHPEDAEQLGVADGDAVVVETEWGRARARARVTPRQKRGTLFMPFHFPETNMIASELLDRKSLMPELKVAACRIWRGE
ncbi:MAG: formate dehydrogenase subunit alpha [Methanothrix sp.]|nr:formate dehydrogenase subunit alpha [Methanothrix sp.]MCX8206379.1 formate dehydrogenase subunit alpha [Methanothrix sp.]